MPITVKAMRLVAYKGFTDYRAHFDRESNILVGANNAGKSTIVGALRLVAALMPGARRRAPDTRGVTQGRPVTAWSVTAAALDVAAFGNDNVRYDFRDKEARVEVIFSNGVACHIVWPEREDDEDNPPPFFFLSGSKKFASLTPRRIAQEQTPNIGVVPSLFPVEDRELQIGSEALRLNMTSRRTSRSFRNALLAVYDDVDNPEGDTWQELLDFVLGLTPELEQLSVRASPVDRGPNELDVFYEEAGAHERELVWAGDGLQIWLQSMFHLWRNRAADVLVLDEPDVFLHPDLQRRLARVVFAKPWQTMLATHSVEVLAEAPPGAALWVDRRRSHTDRPKHDGALTMLGARLGSGLELNVARALRGGVALFVEGQDMAVLSRLADKSGAPRVALGAELAVIPLGGFDRHVLASAFAEVLAVLGSTVHVEIILDRDLRSAGKVAEVTQNIESSGCKVHIWRRKELESYVLDSGAIAVRTGLAIQEADALLNEVIESLKDETRRALTGRRLDEFRNTKQDDRTTLIDAEAEFDALWTEVSRRITVVHPKRVISELNERLQGRRLKTVNATILARYIAPEDVPSEMRGLLRHVESLLPV